MPNFTNRLQHAWNAFFNKDPTPKFNNYAEMGAATSIRPDRIRLTRGNERSIVTSIYNRIALDVSATTIEHVRLDQNGRYSETINSGLNECLTLSANRDQTNRSFIQDVVMSLFDEGCIAIVPTDTNDNMLRNGSFDILSMRVGKILTWYPRNVQVRVYNENTGKKEDLVLPKDKIAIIENPLYAVMNEPNSTMKRLNRKLALLDVVDEQTSSGRLDLIIQLPYTVKTESKRQYAETRRKDIEAQLTGSRYGIAYTDGTEHITQLNKPVDNRLLEQISNLTTLLYTQLGITAEIMNGTADEKVMLNYYNRTIEPILSSIVDEMKRKFLTKTARTQRQTIFFFRDPFKLVPASELADIADRFTRNEIMTSNEMRQIIGLKPADDPNADQLRNKNLYGGVGTDGIEYAPGYEGMADETYEDTGEEEPVDETYEDTGEEAPVDETYEDTGEEAPVDEDTDDVIIDVDTLVDDIPIDEQAVGEAEINIVTENDRPVNANTKVSDLT